MTFRSRPPSLISFVLFVVANGCASSGEGAPATNAAPGGTTETQEAAPACVKPEAGHYFVDVSPKTTCPWWDSTEDRTTMHVTEDSVRYPHTDDLCGDVQWNGCTLGDECGPIKIDTGSQGWIGKGSLAITFSDDSHFAGTVTYDIGHECLMILEVRGEHLALGK